HRLEAGRNAVVCGCLLDHGNSVPGDHPADVHDSEDPARARANRGGIGCRNIGRTPSWPLECWLLSLCALEFSVRIHLWHSTCLSKPGRISKMPEVMEEVGRSQRFTSAEPPAPRRSPVKFILLGMLAIGVASGVWA